MFTSLSTCQLLFAHNCVYSLTAVSLAWETSQHAQAVDRFTVKTLYDVIWKQKGRINIHNSRQFVITFHFGANEMSCQRKQEQAGVVIFKCVGIFKCLTHLNCV